MYYKKKIQLNFLNYKQILAILLYQYYQCAALSAKLICLFILVFLVLFPYHYLIYFTNKLNKFSKIVAEINYIFHQVYALNFYFISVTCVNFLNYRQIQEEFPNCQYEQTKYLNFINIVFLMVYFLFLGNKKCTKILTKTILLWLKENGL